MNGRLILWSIACATVVAASSIVSAQTPGANDASSPGHRHHQWGNNIERMTKTLDLTPDQQARIAPILEQSQSQMQAARQESKQKVGAVRDNVRTQIRPLLTAAQQQKLNEFRTARQTRDSGQARSSRHWFRHERRWDNALGRMTERLDLTADQQAKIGPILEQAKPQMQAARQELREKTSAIRDNTRSQIRPLLTQTQQQKWDAIQRARDDVRRAREEMRAALAKK